MKRLIKINSKNFPDRYKEFTNFRASYGFVLLDNKNITLFLDSRYLSAAQKAGFAVYSINEMPRNNCILDAWELTIAEYHNFGFQNCVINSEICLNDQNFQHEKFLPYLDFFKITPYFVSNKLFSCNPCGPFVLSNGDVQKFELTQLSNVYFDEELVWLYFLPYLNMANSINDPYKMRQSICSDMIGYKKFLQKEAISWMKFWQIIDDDYVEYTELSAAELFTQIRQQVHNSVNFKNAFTPIIANETNSGFIHHASSDNQLRAGLLLTDIGTNVDSFCSDITRTFLLADSINYEIKKAYTNVLKAHIAVAIAELNITASINELSNIADNYVNFPHSLGHGVGANEVHAYPIINSSNKNYFLDGMIITNEPGYYCADFGIRLESLMRCIIAQTTTFEYLTYIPFDVKLVIFEELDAKEKRWLSNFHKICYKELEEHINLEFLHKKVAEFIERG